MTKTYRKWKQWFDMKFKEKHDAVSWDSINRFSCMTEKVLGSPNFKEDELAMMSYRLFNPLTGLTATGPKVKMWYDTLDKIRGVCVGPDGCLNSCPDDPEAHGMHRLLYMHQDSLLLLLTMLILHETAYKGVVDFVYDCSNHGKFSKTQTKRRAGYLAEQGFDVTPAADHLLRNAIAHSSFRVADDGSVWVADISKKPSLAQYNATPASPPPEAKYYMRQELINKFEDSQSLIVDAVDGVVYWFHVNYVMNRLFDDQFFGSTERDNVREAAWSEMERSNIRDWERILGKFEQMLP